MSGTTRRLVGALLFMPIIALVAVSQPASQWLLMALAALMVLEFSSMLALPMALRAALLMDFVLFALPAPIFAGIETTGDTVSQINERVTSIAEKRRSS